MNTLLPSEYSIRSATAEDTAAVWELISTVLRSYGITPDRQATDQDLNDLSASFGPGHGAFFVLLHGRAMVGTVALRFCPDQRVELCRMYLLATHRGRGLGRRLLEQALAAAQAAGMRTVFLKTASVLIEAIGLYRKFGFAEVPGAHAEGNCDLFMERSFARTP